MTQAVTEADATENQSVEGEGAQDDLDSLLNEFEEQTETKPSEQKIDADEIKEVVNYINEDRQTKALEAQKNDINSAVESIESSLEDLDGMPSKRVIRGLLQDIAAEDDAVRKAFAQRKENPKAWNAALKRATKEIREEFSVDKQTTSDRNALSAAVHSASSKQPEPTEQKNWGQMSDFEFQNEKTKILRGG